MSIQSLTIATVLTGAIVVTGFSIGQAIAKKSIPQIYSQPNIQQKSQKSNENKTLFQKVFGKKTDGIAPTFTPPSTEKPHTTSPTGTAKNKTATPSQLTIAPTTIMLTDTPSPIPTDTPSVSVSSTPIPTQTSPTQSPTSVPSSTATIQIDAVWHNGSSDEPLYKGIVKVKDSNAGTTLAQGTTSSSGRLTLSNVPANKKVDVILLKPADWQTEYCGDKQTFDLASGQFKGLSMRLRPQGSNPCEK